MELYSYTAHELHDLLIRREVTARDIAESVFKRIDEVDPSVKAYITLTRDLAFSQADAVDRKIAAGEEIAPLAGIPIALKDNLSTRDIRTTCASKILDNYVPPYDATVVEKVRDNDMVVIGKTNMDEFAMGSSTENSGFFETRNPWDLDRVPGGSSGGSAAAVSAREAILALGSDTGGSIRQPASFCGVVGLKPTYGRVSRYGLVAFASSLDQIGPITRDVTDCALLMNIIAGRDIRDSTSVDQPCPDYTAFLIPDITGFKIGVPKEYFGPGLSPDVRDAIEAAMGKFEDMGATLVEVTLPHTEYALATYYLVATAEASSNLARYDGVRYGLRVKEAPDSVMMTKRTRKEGFGAEVKRRIMLGTYALSSGYYDAYYLKALKVRTLLIEDFDRAFESCDAIISPTSPTVAFRIGEKIQDPLSMYLSDVYTVTANLAALPAISIPCGFAADGMPVGLQLLGKHFDEPTLFRLAYAFEAASGLRSLSPPLCAVR
ncbi:MAG TPA: Asp-tRNA(Asn)/Glu-tRNA(Gln) amidotransferase subunit GatA [Firmicutes bacterium]|nr:Asp-tRNA(Asn)/Glu-tRNA(Gln) amidotransferase subunit GatA [Bacillota bacterium]HHY98189.1 Asp-tRNA(Asn)/Glu-tRNA(Gln) amidotransferase subunit GatA [Bacillota bacterium]